MDMQGALRARLLNQTAAGTRVYWVTRPQASARPAITLQTISGGRPRTYAGLQGFRDSRVQMDIWAATYAEARSVAEAAIAALEPIKTISNGIIFDSIFFDSERDILERVGTTDIHRTSIDLIVWHQPA
jgi:hypothetical protein